MTNKKFSPHLERAKECWRLLLQPGDLAIDATLGNGHDSLFLLELGAEIIGFDIQSKAIEEVKKKTRDQKITLYHQSHETIASIPLPQPPKLIVYNLGYLPGGDKSITTLSSSTLKSVQHSLERLDPKGALSIICYPGHEEGLKEEAFLLEWASSLNPLKWNVRHERWINRRRSPSFLWIVSLQP
jgi:16S rRNA C1402 N4-methylase RsmH